MAKRSVILTLACFAAVAHGSSWAGMATFNDLATFQSAAGALKTDSFNSIPLPASGKLQVNGSTVDGISFSGNAFIATPPATANGIDWGTGSVLQLGSSAPLTLSFAPTTAFAALFGSSALQSYDIAVTFDKITFFNPRTSTTPALAFYGWVSDTPFSSVTIRGAEGAPVLDNLMFATASNGIPEPGSPMLVAAGLLGCLTVLGRVRRR